MTARAFYELVQKASLHSDSVALHAEGGIFFEPNVNATTGRRSPGFLHSFYGPASPPYGWDFDKVFSSMPPSLQGLYSACNGFSLFRHTLVLGGFPVGGHLGGRGQNPISILYGNTIDLPDIVPDGIDAGTHVWFGSYSDGDGYDVRCSQDGAVILLPRHRTGPVLRRWGSVDEYLNAEGERLCYEFERRGCFMSPREVIRAPV